MTTETQAKLERLRHYGTRYEIIAEHQDGAKVFVMYGQKTKRAMESGLIENDRIYLLAKATGTRAESWRVSADGITSGGWRVKPSGRTQRSAITEGEMEETIYTDEWDGTEAA